MVERFERFSLAIFEISRHWHKIAADEMAQYELKGPHAIYLIIMYHHPEGLTAALLGEKCGKDKADVSRTISLLEQKGLIKREEVNHNGYRALLRLTETGEEAAKHLCERVGVAVEHAGCGLSDEKRDIFYEALELIASNLQALSKEGLPQR